MAEIHKTQQWRETIEELKREQLAEGVRDYLKKFFFKKPTVIPTPVPAAPLPPSSGGIVTPNPARAKEYINQLNDILNRHQQALSTYVSKLNIRSIKRKMEELDFRQIPAGSHRSKPLEIPAPVGPVTTPSFSSPKAPEKGEFPPVGKKPLTVPPKIKKKTDLPHNTIFEALSREWKPRIEGLNNVMVDAYWDVMTFLLQIAKDSGYTPKKTTDIKSLLSEMKNFSILDKKTLHILRTKLIGFLTTYRILEGWIQLFRRTEQAQAAAEKKAAKRHIP